MDYLKKLIVDLELHSVEGIRACFQHGIDPNDRYQNRPLLHELIGEYTRSPRFKECVSVFMEYGLTPDDPVLLAVLTDDATTLDTLLNTRPDLVSKTYALPCAYTPFYEVSLLHICAEFNHVRCARVLLDHGLDINMAAGRDSHGFGGQTAIFHTVNQNNNQSADMLHFLLDHSADLNITVPGLIWGKGYDWETLIPSVNPISYAMMGLLPQMHRDEKTIADTVSMLLKSAYGIDYTPANVPCKYLLS